MRRLIGGFAYIALGLGAGALSAYFLIEQSGAVQVSDGSPWYQRDLSQTGEDGYYIRAHFMLGGRLPPPPGQLMELSADADDEGRQLSAQCVYRLTAQGPLPPWWSVSVAEPGPLSASRQRALRSDSIIRTAKGETLIQISAQPQPGNWLRVPPSSRFALLFTASPARPQPAARSPFAIARVSCR